MFFWNVCQFFFFMIFFSVDNAFDFFESINFVVNLKRSFDIYKNKSIEIFSFDDSNVSIVTRVKKRNLINRKLTNFFHSFSYFGTQNAFSFNEKNITNFLNIYDEICKVYPIINKNKIRRLHQYCTSVINEYVKIIFIENNLKWKKIRKILRQKFNKVDIFQKIIIFNYLKTLKNIRQTKFSEMFWYIRKYVAAFSHFFAKKKTGNAFSKQMIFAEFVKRVCVWFCEKNELWWRRRWNDFLWWIKKKLFENFRKILKRSMKHKISIKYRRKWTNWSKISKILFRWKKFKFKTMKW